MSNPALFLPDVDATGQLAQQVAQALPHNPASWIILLRGELGAGKSTFARAMLHALGFHGAVPSPTYTLVEPYRIDSVRIYHIDLYRISAVEELEFLGWSELQDGLMLVEWPERVAGLDQDADIIIDLRYEGEGRMAEVAAISTRAVQTLLPVSQIPARG